MSIANDRIGSEIADEVPESSVSCLQPDQPPSTLSELLVLLERNRPKELPMLRSTAVKVAEFQRLRPDEISLDRVFETHRLFRRYLETRKYKENSIRTYVYYAHMLIQKARCFGWRSYQNLSREWQQVLSLAPKKMCTDAARFLAGVKKNPNDVTSDDADHWAEIRLQEGLSHKYLNQAKGRFWKLLRECGMTDYRPLSNIRAEAYHTPFDQLPRPLKAEVEQLVKWKTAEFSIGRPKGAQIREKTAERIREKVCQLVGFATNIRGQSGFESLAQLVREDLVSDYASWSINEREVKGDTLRSHLGRLLVAMRQHRSYASMDLSWFKILLESLPIEDETERRMRKERKYLEYAVVENIPAQIHAERLAASMNSKGHAAELVKEELLIKWLLTLPWRQRNIRECRIGGSNPNIFKAKLPSGRALDMPDWVRDEAQRNPEATFWQMRFLPKETKTGREIRAFVPRQLIQPLEEYLTEFRPHLLKSSEPGTLFVTKDGAPMSQGHVYDLVTRLTSRHGGRSVNPHLFRDIVAFAWLKEHPRDYLTLSKILWHANINVTIKTYGSRFDESSGVCAMEVWLEERKTRAKSK